MNGPRIDKEFFFSKGAHLEPLSRVLLACTGIYFFLSTSSKAFSQAPLLVFLVGCALTFLGLNGLRFSGIAISKDGLKVESYTVPAPTPVSPIALKDSPLDGSGDSGWTPLDINWNTKHSIAGIATTASGETTRADQIREVYAINNDINHLFVLTSDGRALKLDFMQTPDASSGAGIQ